MKTWDGEVLRFLIEAYMNEYLVGYIVKFWVKIECQTETGKSNRWGCGPSKFPWTYSDKETCYLLEGKVKVTPAGSDESVEIGAGDLVVFPKGMSCTWDVSVAVDKHYNFG